MTATLMKCTGWIRRLLNTSKAIAAKSGDNQTSRNTTGDTNAMRATAANASATVAARIKRLWISGLRTVHNRGPKEPSEQHHIDQGKQQESSCPVDRPFSGVHMQDRRSEADYQPEHEYQNSVCNSHVPNAAMQTHSTCGHKRHLGY